MNEDAYTRKAFDCIAETYSRFPVVITKGEGVFLWDDSGKKYIDFTSGIAVTSLGHCNPRVVQAVTKQVQELFHISNLYWTKPQAQLAQLLCEHSFAEKVFFCNSGAESVEAAIKLARKYGHDTRGPDCYQIVCLEGSFHGRTLAAITATGQPVYQRGFEPLPDGFTHVPPNNVHALKLAADKRTAAILMEPILGEGGVHVLDNDFLKAARDIANDIGALLIFDEIQVGMGRTGKMFAYQHTDVEPDVMCLAKALANGLPIGAMLAKEDVMKHLGPGTHASTFGGNPVSCSAAIEVINQLTEPGALEGIVELGDYLMAQLRGLAKRHKVIKDVRGRGLIQAVEFERELPGLANHLLDQGFLVIVAHNRLLRLLPPFVMERKHIDLLIEKLDSYLAENT
ncbi:MAG: aspartate aminotransferase family protein [Thermodesulfobacteria bacterium]|nr:aspartate aminotransferase family protein [Thermodesulfobacteriota bacterium]